MRVHHNEERLARRVQNFHGRIPTLTVEPPDKLPHATGPNRGLMPELCHIGQMESRVDCKSTDDNLNSTKDPRLCSALKHAN